MPRSGYLKKEARHNQADLPGFFGPFFIGE